MIKQKMHFFEHKHTGTHKKTQIPQRGIYETTQRHDTGQLREISPRVVKDSNYRAILSL